MPRVARCVVSRDAITAAFDTAAGGNSYPVIVSPTQLAEIVGVSRKTIELWKAKDRLKGSFRKRGKHVLFWRDKAIDLIFNGPDWSD